jgi:hypothetical protein
VLATLQLLGAWPVTCQLYQAQSGRVMPYATILVTACRRGLHVTRRACRVTTLQAPLLSTAQQAVDGVRSETGSPVQVICTHVPCYCAAVFEFYDMPAMVWQT